MEERMLNPLLPQDVSLNLNLPQPPAIRGLPKMARPRRRSEVQRYASPSSLQSSAEMVGEAGLNTLSAIGNLLDVPASITRDLVWNAGQLLKPTDRINPMADMVNPFDQIYSSEKGLGALFSSDNRKEHRETFRHFGLASEEDTWGNFAADLALDVVTDPLTYMTFGGSAALKSGGTVAKKAGLLGKLGKKTISYVDDAGQEVVEQLGKRRALQETTLKELYKPASDTGDEVLDIFKEDISKNVTDFMRKRDEASDALDSLIRDGSPRPGALEAAQDALEVADGNLVAAQQEYAQRLAKGQDRLLEIEDAKRIEDAAGFDRKGLTEKYGADSPEFKAAHQEFVQQLRGRMDTGDLAGSLGGTVGLVNPITGKALVMDDYIPGAKLWAKSLDTSMGWLARTYPARFGRMLFDSKASGNLEAGAQELATKLHGIKRESEGLAGELAFVGKDSISANLRKIRKDFDEILGSDLDVIRETGDKFDMKAKDGYIQLRSNAEIAESIFHHVRERSSKVGLEEAFDEATSRLIPAKISKDKIEKLGDVVRSTMDEYGATLNKLEDQSYAEVLATGIKGQLINHEAIAHAARMTGENLVRTDPATGRLLKTSGASTASRDPEIAHIPEVFVSQILSDPDLRNVIKQAGDSKAVTEQLANAIMDKYSKVDGILDPNYQPKGKQARADRLAKWVGRNKHKPWFASQLDKWVETLATENVMSSDKLDSLLNFQKHMHDYLAEAKAGKAAGDPRLQKMYEENIKPLAEKISKEAEGIAFSHKLAHARDLAKYVYTHENDSIFSLDRLKNSRAYLESNFNLARMGKGANEYIAANMARAGDVMDGVPVKEALEQAGFEPEIAASYITGLTGVGVEDLDDFVLPTRNAKALTSVMKAHKAGQWQNSLLEFADAITNTWKAGMTVATVKGIPLFPSFFTRNGVSGQFVNVSSGHIPLHKLPEYVKYVRKWQKKLGQPDISEDEILQMALAHGVIGHAQGMDDAVNLTSSLPPTLTQYVKGIMGMDKGTLEKVNELTDELVMRPSEVGKMVEKLPGGRKGRKIMAESAAWGGVLNSHVEYMNRMPMFAWLVDNGWSPKAAADEVKRLQFDYSDLSPVEKNVFKRLMPFYTFSRKAAELTVDTLMRHPGGILSKTIRQAGKESSTDATTPGYLKEQTSIDITDGIPFLSPELKDGTRRYITSMGLPYEDVARLMPFDLKRLATGDVPGSLYRGSREVARSLGSRLHPGITFGIEEMTGRDLYRDQPIAASARPIGETISALAGATGVDVSSGSLPLWAERAASKSPFSRAIGLGRNVARATEAVATGENVPQHASKMASTILPFRITDVSPQAQSYALRENTVDLLKERGWGREAVYTPHSLLDLLSPEDRENALRANALLQHQRRQSSLGRPVNILNRQ